MNWFRLSLMAALVAAASVRAQEIGSDAPGEPPLAGLERAAASRTEAESDRVQAQVHYLQARLALGRGDRAAALRHYQRAWRWDPRQASLLPEIVKLAFQLKRNDEAARYAALAEDGDLNEPLLLRRLATHLTERRDWKRAIRLYEQAQKLEDQRQPRPAKLDLGAAIIRREMGRLYFLTDDFARSSEAFADVLAALDDPASSLSDDAKQLLLDDAAQTYRLWAEALLAAGKLDTAEDLFRRSQAAKDDAGLLAYQLARVAQKRGDPKLARQRLEEYFAAKSDAAGAAPYSLLAELIAGETKDAAEARQQTIERLEQLAAADPENLALRQALANRYLAAEDFKKAEPLLAAIAEKQPASEAAGQLAEVYRRSNRPEKLLALAAQSAATTGSLDLWGDALAALAADKNLVKRLAELAREQPGEAGALLAAGLIAVEAKEFDLSDELFTAAAGGKSPPQPATYWRWGLALLMADEPARSAQVFQRMLDEKIGLAAKDSAEEADTLFYLSAALALNDRTDEALVAARRAAELRPGDQRIAARIGWILHQGDRLDEARQTYVDFLQRFDGRQTLPTTREAVRDARLALSNIDLARGDYPAATEWLQQVLDEFPEDVGAGNDLGYLWADRGEHLQRSLEMIQRAVSADPNNTAYRDSLGWALFRLNRLEDAVRELQTAAAGESGDGVILEHLGDALLQFGRREEALAAFRRAAAALEKAGQAVRLKELRQKLERVEADLPPHP